MKTAISTQQSCSSPSARLVRRYPWLPIGPERYDMGYVRNGTCEQFLLSMAEIELSVLNNHGLADRIASIEKMRSEITAWQSERNKQKCKIKWSFIIEKAWDKMKITYPQL